MIVCSLSEERPLQLGSDQGEWFCRAVLQYITAALCYIEDNKCASVKIESSVVHFMLSFFSQSVCKMRGND